MPGRRGYEIRGTSRRPQHLLLINRLGEIIDVAVKHKGTVQRRREGLGHGSGMFRSTQPPGGSCGVVGNVRLRPGLGLPLLLRVGHSGKDVRREQGIVAIRVDSGKR